VGPNLLYIMADQLRQCTLGCYGNGEVSTPHIDALAAQSARFVNAVSTSPLCTPHRACLMTGRYPTVTGVNANGVKLPAQETGIAEVLAANSYRTEYMGKWHLNGPTGDPAQDPGWVAPKDRQGFQGWLGYNLGHVYYDSKYYLDRDPTVRQIPSGQYEPDFQTDQAIQFMTDNRSHRFCVFLSIGTPHPPGAGGFLPPRGDYHFPYDPEVLTLRPNVDYPDPAWARQKYADYYGVVSNFDWNVGRIVSALQSLGLAQTTIVVVTSDHGDVLGSHYVAFGHFNGKGVVYSESLNVPFALRYPARVPPAIVPDVFTSVDIIPTLLGLCGLASPPGVMGRDFSPLLSGTGLPIDPPWGTVPSTESVLVGMFQGSWLGVHTGEYSLSCGGPNLTPRLLYHNAIDPYQLVDRKSEPAYQTILAHLREELDAWLDYVQY
jgi:arylsulfatase A-like enzyme